MTLDMLEEAMAELCKACRSPGNGDEDTSGPSATHFGKSNNHQAVFSAPALLLFPPTPGKQWFGGINIHIWQPNSPALVIHKHALF